MILQPRFKLLSKTSLLGNQMESVFTVVLVASPFSRVVVVLVVVANCITMTDLGGVGGILKG